MDLIEQLTALVQGDLAAWRGLPPLRPAELVAALGEPAARDATRLGWYPAERWQFDPGALPAPLSAYIRDDTLLMVEAPPPPLAALAALEEPCAVLPHEILRPGSYVHEQLYCARGLVLSVAEPFDQQQPRQIVRCRAIGPINRPEQFGPELYCAFEDQQSWG
jgi:hypothetical protein